jgi:hypothetical protein
VSSRVPYGPSRGVNNKASPSQVQAFLDEFFAKWDEHGWYLRLDRAKNKQTLQELDLLSSEVEDIIRGLTPLNYHSGPNYDNKPYRKTDNPGPLWEFGTMVDDTEVYIKLRLGAPKAAVICVSFHPPKPALNYPLR